MLKIRGCRNPKLTQKLCVFDYFSTTTAQNCLRFSAFATLRSPLTGNRQAKPGRFQTMSLTKFPDCTFYTLGTVLKIRVFVNNPMFFRFSGVPFGFISRVRTRNNFIQGAGVVAIINLISITLRSMGVLHSGLF